MDLSIATSEFQRRGLQKPLVICDLFSALLDALDHGTTYVRARLKAVARRAEGYYPRVALDAKLLELLLARVDGDADTAVQLTNCLRSPPYAPLQGDLDLRDDDRKALFEQLTA